MSKYLKIFDMPGVAYVLPGSLFEFKYSNFESSKVNLKKNCVTSQGPGVVKISKKTRIEYLVSVSLSVKASRACTRPGAKGTKEAVQSIRKLQVKYCTYLSQIIKAKQ